MELPPRSCRAVYRAIRLVASLGIALVARAGPLPVAAEIRLPPVASICDADCIAPQTGRAVSISWTSIESEEAGQYRVTATVIDGPLAGMRARWVIAAGSGERDPRTGARSYHLELPLPTASPSRVRASIDLLPNRQRSILLGSREGSATAPRPTGSVRPRDERSLVSAYARDRSLRVPSVAAPPSRVSGMFVSLASFVVGAPSSAHAVVLGIAPSRGPPRGAPA